MQEVWLSIEEVCELTGDKKETIRRKCKSGEYNSRFEKFGKFKYYFVLLSSLPKEIAQKYLYAKDALKLFCMRTSKSVSIGRNGIYDAQLQITYWAEWMVSEKGRKVFIRRDIHAYQEAWVFDAQTEEYLGKATSVQATAFLAKTDIEKAQFKKAITSKRKEEKLLQDYIQCKYNPTSTELMENLKNSLPKTEFKSSPKISRISNTKMDMVVKEEKKNNLQVEKYVTPLQPKKKLYLTESEKRRDLEQQAM